MDNEREISIQSILRDLVDGAKDGARITPEDRRQNLRWIREKELKAEAPKAHYTFAQQPLIDLLRQAKTAGNPIANAIPGVQPLDDYNLLVRGNSGLNIGGVTEFDLNDETQIKAQAAKYKKDLRDISLAKKVGYLGGAVGNDIVNDSSRNVWWLLNAPQAAQSIAQELTVNTLNPDFFDNETLTDLDKAVNDGLLRYRPTVEPVPDFGAKPGTKEAELEMRANPVNYIPGAPGVSYDQGSKTWGRRRYNPNVINVAAMLPGAIAINSGIGLLGRHEGYAATVPDEDDPRKTGNVIAEVGARYLLGREGRLLEAADALLERPDLTHSEYQKYKAYLRDRDIDLNIFDDGKINFGGILKTNPEGIRGAEVSFMGKSLPINDTLLPAVSSILGSAAGALATRRLGMGKAANVATLFGSGMAGLALGSLGGDAIEDNRRQRNFEARNPGVDYQQYKANAKQLLEDKYSIQRENPRRKQEQEQSKVGFSKRSQQQALQTKTLQQQVLVDQILSGEQKARAQEALRQQEWALAKADAIEKEIQRRQQGTADQTNEQQGLQLT